MSNRRYSTLYSVNNLNIRIGNESKYISTSDLMSISIIDNYDEMTYPIIRLRLYTDISTLEFINEDPDNIYVGFVLSGNIVELNDNSESKPYSIIKGIGSKYINLKGYVETKNNPVSKYDSYIHGLNRDDSLNNNVKVPIELYAFDEKTIHSMKRLVNSVYKNISVGSVIEDIFKQCHVRYNIQAPDNQTRYDQILIPNLSALEAIGYIDQMYGIYKTGGQIYGTMEGNVDVCSSCYNSNSTPEVIKVKSYKNNDEVSGLTNIGSEYIMTTPARSVVVKSETDIERVLNSQLVTDINSMDLSKNTDELNELFENSNIEKIYTPDIIHKTKNKYIANTITQRIKENITQIDVSGTGFNLFKMNISTRYNLAFDQPIRGTKINKKYRPRKIIHVLTNVGSNVFEIQTTMNLC